MTVSQAPSRVMPSNGSTTTDPTSRWSARTRWCSTPARSGGASVIPPVLSGIEGAEPAVVEHERVAALDAHLWTYADESFLHHAAEGDGAGQPIYLTDKEENPNRANVRFFVDGAPLGDLSGCDRAVVIFDGNDSAAVFAEAVSIPETSMLGTDGEGFKVMMEVVLPIFNAMTAGVAVGLMESAVARTASHVAGAKYEHLGASIADLPTIRNYLARMRCKTDMAKTLLDDTLTALDKGEQKIKRAAPDVDLLAFLREHTAGRDKAKGTESVALN